MELWELIVWLVIGGLAGWLASVIMKTDAQQGIIGNIIVGILGAILGGWLLSLIDIGGSGMIFRFLTAVLGAVILIWVFGLLTGKRR